LEKLDFKLTFKDDLYSVVNVIVIDTLLRIRTALFLNEHRGLHCATG